MIRRVLGGRRGLSGPLGSVVGLTYREKVLGFNPVVYWPLNELSGITAVNAAGNSALNGAYSGVTLNSVDGPVVGERAGEWDGINDFCNAYTATLPGVFPHAVGSVTFWLRSSSYVRSPPDVGFWFGTASGINHIAAYSSTSGLICVRQRNSTPKQVVVSSGDIGANQWQPFGMSWSVSLDRLRVYHLGVQYGATQTGILAWTTSVLSTSQCVIGAQATTPSFVWVGNVAHLAFYPVELDAAAFASLAII